MAGEGTNMQKQPCLGISAMVNMGIQRGYGRRATSPCTTNASHRLATDCDAGLRKPWKRRACSNKGLSMKMLERKGDAHHCT